MCFNEDRKSSIIMLKLDKSYKESYVGGSLMVSELELLSSIVPHTTFSMNVLEYFIRKYLRRSLRGDIGYLTSEFYAVKPIAFFVRS